MAAQRSTDERMRIARECLRIERAGGDVLAYLLTENYYTPRATWIHLQREFLGRKPWQYKDGKPREAEKKGMTSMALTNEQRLRAAEIAIEGGDPRVFLEDCGILNTAGTWWTVKEWLKKNHPEMAAKVPDKLKPAGEYQNVRVDKGMPKETPEKILGKDKDEFEKMPTVKVDGEPKIETPEGNKVEVVETPEGCSGLFHGTKGEKAARITKPVNFGGFEVTAIRDENLGEFYYDRKFGFIDWRTPEGEEISFTPDAWREMYRKLPEILGVLGVQV